MSSIAYDPSLSDWLGDPGRSKWWSSLVLHSVLTDVVDVPARALEVIWDCSIRHVFYVWECVYATLPVGSLSTGL